MSEVASQKAPHGKVGWFELFYDLVIVAAVGYAAHTFAEHPSWGLGVWIAAWTLIMFVLWSLTSLHHNLFPGDSAARRGLVLLQMLALVVAALGSVADEGLPNSVGFTAFAVAFGSVAVMYALPRGAQGRHAEARRILAGGSGIGALVLLTGMLLPDDAPWTLSGWPVVDPGCRSRDSRPGPAAPRSRIPSSSSSRSWWCSRSGPCTSPACCPPAHYTTSDDCARG